MIRPERPPNFDEIVAAFPGAAGPGVIFAWGDDIYNPSGVVIPPALLAHEAVHGERQLKPNGAMTRTVNIENWWLKYILDPEFRYKEELEAHAAEMRAQPTRDRNARAMIHIAAARRLIAPLYRYGVAQRTFGQALRDLRREIEG